MNTPSYAQWLKKTATTIEKLKLKVFSLRDPFPRSEKPLREVQETVASICKEILQICGMPPEIWENLQQSAPNYQAQKKVTLDTFHAIARKNGNNLAHIFLRIKNIDNATLEALKRKQYCSILPILPGDSHTRPTSATTQASTGEIGYHFRKNLRMQLIHTQGIIVQETSAQSNNSKFLDSTPHHSARHSTRRASPDIP